MPGGAGLLNGSDDNKYGYCSALVGDKKFDVAGVLTVSVLGAPGVLGLMDLFL